MSEAQYNDAKQMELLRKQQAEALSKAQATGDVDDIRRLSMINHRIHVERARQRGQWERMPIDNARILK